MTTENDLLGYLVVLNDKTTISLLTDTEKERGAAAMMGCLSRLTDTLDSMSQIDSYTLMQLIRMREAINSDPRSMTDMSVVHQKATEACASAVFEYYKKYFRAG